MYFYTYAYLRQDSSPYYIGKGIGNRAYRRDRVIKPPKDKSRILILKQNLTEEESFKHEIYMIAMFGRKDLGTGILHNRTDGGDGGCGFSSEIIEKIRQARLNQSCPRTGKNHSIQTRQEYSDKRLKYLYTFISPEGEIFPDTTPLIISQKFPHLRRDLLQAVGSGRRKSHRGWTGSKVARSFEPAPKLVV
jgi:hypothetical protein